MKSTGIVGRSGSASRKRRLFNSFAHLILLLGALTMIMPFVWMISTSLKSSQETFDFPPRLIPRTPTIQNYIKAWRMAPFGLYFKNSSIVSAVVTVAQLFFCSLAAYVFAKFRFWGKDLMFGLVLAKLMIPIQVLIVPLFVMIIHLGMINSLRAVILPDLIGAYGIFMLRQFIVGIPDELMDSARLDGCSDFLIYRRIILPLIIPALSIFAIVTFINTWNDFLWPLIVLNSPDKFTLPLGLSVFSDAYVEENNLRMAASLIVLLPVVAVFAVFQKQIIGSVSLSGLKEG